MTPKDIQIFLIVLSGTLFPGCSPPTYGTLGNADCFSKFFLRKPPELPQFYPDGRYGRGKGKLYGRTEGVERQPK